MERLTESAASKEPQTGHVVGELDLQVATTHPVVDTQSDKHRRVRLVLAELVEELANAIPVADKVGELVVLHA
jgi:hypothetical protein